MPYSVLYILIIQKGRVDDSEVPVPSACDLPVKGTWASITRFPILSSTSMCSFVWAKRPKGFHSAVHHSLCWDCYQNTKEVFGSSAALWQYSDSVPQTLAWLEKCPLKSVNLSNLKCSIMMNLEGCVEGEQMLCVFTCSLGTQSTNLCDQASTSFGVLFII